MRKIKKFYTKIVHRLIVKYLMSCGGAFHHGVYGVDGRYVVIMNDETYHYYKGLYRPQLTLKQNSGSDFDGDTLKQ
jgi:hypothetical protein